MLWSSAILNFVQNEPAKCTGCITKSNERITGVYSPFLWMSTIRSIDRTIWHLPYPGRGNLVEWIACSQYISSDGKRDCVKIFIVNPSKLVDVYNVRPSLGRHLGIIDINPVLNIDHGNNKITSSTVQVRWRFLAVTIYLFLQIQKASWKAVFENYIQRPWSLFQSVGELGISYFNSVYQFRREILSWCTYAAKYFLPSLKFS